jgi:hypothetical protein
MARARRKQPSQFVDHEAPPRARTSPRVCPRCDLEVPGEMITHLQSHSPIELCQRCDATEKGWKLDCDAVQYVRQDVSIFYCSHCGRYAPVRPGKEVSAADPPSEREDPSRAPQPCQP